MSLRATSAAVLLFIVAMLFALPGGASACACGEIRGVVVAHGTSPAGAPWRIKASRLIGLNPAQPRVPYLQSDFSVGDPDGNGYVFAMPLPVPQHFVFNANAGIDEYPESDLSGVTTERAVELQVEMNDGQVLTVEPELPPLSLRQRFTWIRGLRFFDAFFSAPQRPRLVTAFDQSGRVLGRSKGHHGLFLAWQEG